MSNNEASVRNLQPVLPSIGGYGNGSEYSQTSSIMPKSSTIKNSSDVTILLPPVSSSTNRQPMQFLSAGRFKQSDEYSYLSSNEQLVHLQEQQNHRIQLTSSYLINKYFRQQQ
jgi:hypothetical protein